MAKPDYYKILGLQPGATVSEIKRSYRRLALKYHPDRNPDNEESEEQFKWIAEAYHVLNDPEKRLNYDRDFFARHQDVLKDFKNFEERLFYAPAHDVLGDFFRGFYASAQGRSRPRGQKGKDVRYNLKISFIEAALGAEIEIKIPYQKECPVCQGTGAKSGSSSPACAACRGKGRIKSRKGPLEFFKTCHVCGGKGSVVNASCTKCDGKGTVHSTRLLSIPVPPGVETGARLRVRGQGLPGYHGGAAGDLVVVVDVQEHPLLERNGLNIMCEVPVPFFVAILGGKIEIPTLEGKKQIRISQGTQSGKEIIVPGKGLLSPNKKKRGDLIIEIKVEMPVKLSRQEKSLLKEFTKHYGLERYPSALQYTRKMKTIYRTKR